jgi:hypothetical protein
MKLRENIGPIAIAIASGASATAFFLSSGVLPRSAFVVSWLTIAGACWGAVVYCLSRANEHLASGSETPSWSRLLYLRSFPLEDYDLEGRRWLRAHRLAGIVMGVVWLGGGVIVLNRLFP